MQFFTIINSIDGMNCEQIFRFIDYDGTRDCHNKLCMQYVFAQSNKCTFSRSVCRSVVDLCGILSYDN